MIWVTIVAAPFVEHAAFMTGRFTGWAIALALLQAAALAVMAWRSGRGALRWGGVAAALLLLAVLVVRLAQRGAPAPSTVLAVSGVTHAMLYGTLLLVFAQSLRGRGRDLVTLIATRLRGTLTPALARYTRQVTQAWCWFFAADLAVSALLLGLAPAWVWSLFINVLDGPLVLVMFAAEYAVRRWRFRDLPHGSPLAALRSYTGRPGHG